MLVSAGPLRAAEPIALAVLDFDTSGAPELRGPAGAGFADLLAVALSTREGVRLVEREALRQAIEEQVLGLSGAVDLATAARVRRLVGAQVLVTGRVFAASNRLVVTARAIGAETGHVEAVAAEGRGEADLRTLAEGIAEKIGRLLAARSSAFVASRPDPQESSADLTKATAGRALPRVAIRMRETILNVDQQRSTAAHELASLLLASGVEVRHAAAEQLPVALDDYLEGPLPQGDALASVDVIIFGEAVGRFGLRTGDLVSASARVTLTAVDAKRRRVLAAADAERKGIDVVPHEAAIQAITGATRDSAQALLPKLVGAWNRRAHGSGVGADAAGRAGD